MQSKSIVFLFCFVFLFFYMQSKSIVERLNGANNAMLKKLVKQHSSVDAIPGPVKVRYLI